MEIKDIGRAYELKEDLIENIAIFKKLKSAGRIERITITISEENGYNTEHIPIDFNGEGYFTKELAKEIVDRIILEYDQYIDDIQTKLDKLLNPHHSINPSNEKIEQ